MLFTVVVEKEKLAKLLPRSIILFSYLRFLDKHLFSKGAPGL